MKFTGLDKIRFINLCKNNKLNIWNITSENDYVIMCCDVASFYKMKKLEENVMARLNYCKEEVCYFRQ